MQKQDECWTMLILFVNLNGLHWEVVMDFDLKQVLFDTFQALLVAGNLYPLFAAVTCSYDSWTARNL